MARFGLRNLLALLGVAGVLLLVLAGAAGVPPASTDAAPLVQATATPTCLTQGGSVNRSCWSYLTYSTTGDPAAQLNTYSLQGYDVVAAAHDGTTWRIILRRLLFGALP